MAGEAIGTLMPTARRNFWRAGERDKVEDEEGNERRCEGMTSDRRGVLSVDMLNIE